jgi:ADP-ribosylglycohydrolase
MNKKSRYIGAIKLSAIGDALGWITEFEKSKTSIKKKYGCEYINQFYEWKKQVGGRFNGYIDHLEKGSYSDDTQMILCVARSIGFNGKVDHNYFSKCELPEWLLYARGAGRTVKNAARKISRKSAKWNKNFYTYQVNKNQRIDYRATGANGAAMRILPIALANYGKVELLKEEIFSNSIVTHGHPRAIAGAMLYGYAISTILGYTKNNFNYEEFLTKLGKEIHHNLEISFIESPKFVHWQEEWNSKSKDSFTNLFHRTLMETQIYLRDIYKHLRNNSNDIKVLSEIGCYAPETKGSGISTVIAGIYLFCKYVDKSVEGIENAVNLIGTDTDSIAAFTGGLLGALYGYDIIPKKYRSVQDANYLEHIGKRLLSISERSLHPESNNFRSQLESYDIAINKDLGVNDELYLTTLGKGIVRNIERQKTLIKDKFNLIVDVEFEIGQTCRFAKVHSKNLE